MKKLNSVGSPLPETMDWNKPQWLIDIANRTVVLSTGKHGSEYFSGMCMPCEDAPEGIYSKYWTKKSFKVLDFEINFIISNED
jgi:hypothetical protein